MFKVAYARGALQALIDTNVVKVANEEVADAMAEVAGEGLPEEPVGEVAPEQTAALASNLVQLADALQTSADAAAGAAEAAVKGAASNDENTQNSAAGDTEEAAMENADRPEGYANVGVAGVGTQEASGEGAIGTERPNPPSNAAEGASNSATEAVKGAALRNLIRKLSQDGSLITGDKERQENDSPEAAKHTEEAKMENNRRPEGYANVGEDGVGTQTQAGKGMIGLEEQKGEVQGANSATKTSEEKMYMQAFQQVASKYARYLPKQLNDAEKVAAIQGLLAMEPSDRNRAANFMAKHAEMPEGLAAYVESKKEDGDEKKEDESKEHESKESPAHEESEKKEESKEEKKASSKRDLLQRLRNLS